jgi:hypothetical protein
VFWGMDLVRNKFIELHGLPAAFPFDLYLLSAFKVMMMKMMMLLLLMVMMMMTADMRSLCSGAWTWCCSAFPFDLYLLSAFKVWMIED